MEIGIDSFVATSSALGEEPPVGDADRMAFLLDEIVAADRAGLDVFGVGEHHRSDYLDSATAVILAAAAARTQDIRLTSAVTVLSAADPVRVFQEFATLDLIARGRAEMVVGRGSSIEAYPLFGFDLKDYDALFAEKLDLLLAIRERASIDWMGKFRAPLSGQGIYPRPQQPVLPVWLGVGGTPQSFVRAGTLGLPLMIAIIGGEIARFRPLVDLYRRAGAAGGACAGDSEGRRPRAGLCRGYRRSGARYVLPWLAVYVHQGWRGARLAAGDPRAIRPDDRPARRVPDRQPRHGGRAIAAGGPRSGRNRPGDAADEFGGARSAGDAALNRVARAGGSAARAIAGQRQRSRSARMSRNAVTRAGRKRVPGITA